MDFISINKKLWNAKTRVHVKSAFYDQENFLKGKSSLNKIELDLLGEVRGKSILHLQCHFGQDTLSLARLGANVVGVDFSEEAVAIAKDTARELELNATFICSNVFDLPNLLDKTFDIVFASYGVISWHPDLKPWAALINNYLKPGGRHVFVEFHPYIWMWEEDFKRLEYSYFNEGAIVEQNEGSYADPNANISLQSYCWNHSIEDSLQSMIDEGLLITAFREYNYSPYQIFNDMVVVENGFQVSGMENKIPMVFGFEVKKPNY